MAASEKVIAIWTVRNELYFSSEGYINQFESFYNKSNLSNHQSLRRTRVL